MPAPISSHNVAAQLIIIIILRIAAGAFSQDHAPFVTYCSGDTITASSPYLSNLRNFISELVSSTPTSSSYFSLINSNTSPIIYGLAQCRPDVSSVACAACLNNTASIAPKPHGGCELKTSAFLRDDNCLLMYSEQKFYAAPQEQLFVFGINGLQNASDSSRDVESLMNHVVGSAAAAELRFAVGNASVDGGHIFGMGWCSMDLTSEDCFQCLNNGVLKVMPARKNRGICSTVSCAARFETYQFYSSYMIQPDEPAGGNSKNNNKTTAVTPVVSGNNDNKTVVAPVASGGNNYNKTTAITSVASEGNGNDKTTAIALGVSGAAAFLLFFTLFI